ACIEMPHVAGVHQIKNAFLASAYQPIRSRKKHRSRSAKIQVSVIEIDVIVRREVVEWCEAWGCELNKALTVGCPSQMSVERPVSCHEVNVAACVCRQTLTGLPDS